MSYIIPQEIWDELGSDAYTRVRTEIVGTGNGVISTLSLNHPYVISGSATIYTGGTAATSCTLDLDEGQIIGLTASSGSAITVDYNYADIPDSKVQAIISSSDAMSEELTGRKFSTQTNNTEYLDVDEDQKEFFLSNYPIITMSSLQVNTNDVTSTPNWSSSTEGIGNDYIMNSDDRKAGRFRFIEIGLSKGIDRIKAVYDYGYAITAPQYFLAQELSRLLAVRQMTNSSVYKSMFKGYDNFKPVRLEEINVRIEELIRLLKKQSISSI